MYWYGIAKVEIALSTGHAYHTSRYQATPPSEDSLEGKGQHYLPVVGCPVPQEDGVSTSAYTTP